MIRLGAAAVRRDDEAFNLANLTCPGFLAARSDSRDGHRVGSTPIVAAILGIWPDSNRFAGLSEGLKRFCARSRSSIFRQCWGARSGANTFFPPIPHILRGKWRASSPRRCCRMS